MKCAILLCLLVGLIAVSEAKSYKKTWLEEKLRDLALKQRRMGGPKGPGGSDEGDEPPTGSNQEGEALGGPGEGEHDGEGEEGGEGEHGPCFTIKDLEDVIAFLKEGEEEFGGEGDMGPPVAGGEGGAPADEGPLKRKYQDVSSIARTLLKILADRKVDNYSFIYLTYFAISIAFIARTNMIRQNEYHFCMYKCDMKKIPKLAR
ncbi:uncharacterized protein LOC132754214 [Ruditapes philippinarum]|uniref:uncharacterized protein LOC132754214 n=1 Tax=Ruditapes philippinarum TaxID=129788 RepID=UPI00295B4077|nr:uncharacterized protein LOC132754214 [Ruditapes philippinarum]